MLKVRKCLVMVLFVTVSLVVFYGNAMSANVKININTASVEELMQLKKIGEKYALRIIEHREKEGPFEKPEDIIYVKGIGNKTYEINKETIVVTSVPSE